MRACSGTSSRLPSLGQLRDFAPEQFYQIVDVAAFGEEAVDVNAQRAASVQDGRRQPRAARALDPLLECALQLVLLGGRPLARPRRKVAHAAERGLDLAHALELLQLVE